ncbi:DUF4249 domain-containing protein [Paracrocinitomix mangrovi]|uniref:DUF4249 domain-containing protein n=1 Tax=Paracrocinitomix mangrovi TaxID=2862509 RepID=UPI001C8E267A|nr:DUF4249 domain-containing protein [Paracrocinitomix mangrovi]UKN03358.1 DUF4249 domain-containing protein [Paracrocinitomix mangrovi]
MKKLVFIILPLVLFIASCEKVIDVPLNDADIQTIVEANLSNIPNGSYIKLSRSGSVYQESNFEKVSGAQIVVTDGISTWTFDEDPNEVGTYLNNSFMAVPNSMYNLTVNEGGNTYTARSETYNDVTIDSLTYIEVVGGFGQQESDTSYFTFFNFTDDANNVNFYRAIPYLNGVKSSNYYLINDDLFNGNNYSQPFFAEGDIVDGDTLITMLYSMDEANYKFYTTLANNSNSGPFSPSPGNPVTNIEGGAIGYFGVYLVDIDTLTFP